MPGPPHTGVPRLGRRRKKRSGDEEFDGALGSHADAPTACNAPLTRPGRQILPSLMQSFTPA
jgi:hypothetical protein